MAGHHIILHQGADEETRNGCLQGQIQVPWPPEESHLKELGLHQV